MPSLVETDAAAVSVVAWESLDAEAAFLRLAERRGVFWLDSSLSGPTGGRYSMLGCEPFAVFSARADEWRFELEGKTIEAGRGDPLVRLSYWKNHYAVERRENLDLPFLGGAVGFFSYDFGLRLEPAVAALAGVAEEPDLHWAWYDAAAIWDHVENRGWLVGTGWRRSPQEAIAELTDWLAKAPPVALPPMAALSVPVESSFSRQTYLTAVEHARERIAAGEIYQMNLAQRFTCALREPPAEIYRRLRRANPAPMSAYLDVGEQTLLSSSPERFIAVEHGRIRTFPIKGTRPRGRTPEEDALRRAELCASEKERAELLMIVDLLRNDLGRICRYGSVRVRRLHALESFAAVHHLVGEVEGELRADVELAELMRAMLPGGSITGAPKISAMKTIAELEPVPRGIFSGAIGYLSACGRIDLNIAIRTIVCRDDRANFHAGAGIVWDSSPEAEYEETLAKARPLFTALGAQMPEP